MGIKIGDLDIANEIVDLRYQLVRTQLMLEKIVNSNTNIITPSPEDMKEINDKAFQDIQEKYKSLGIHKK